MGLVLSEIQLVLRSEEEMRTAVVPLGELLMKSHSGK